MSKDLVQRLLVKALLWLAMAMVDLFNQMDDAGPDYQVSEVEQERNPDFPF